MDRFNLTPEFEVQESAWLIRYEASYLCECVSDYTTINIVVGLDTSFDFMDVQ